MFHFLYKTTNKVNGKIYIGIHSTDCIEDGYIGSGTNLLAAKKKYGAGNFSREILEFCDTREQLLDLEKSVVTQDFVDRPDTYNCIVGGGGWKSTPSTFMSEEHRRKISESNKIAQLGNSNRKNSTTSDSARENMKRSSGKGKPKPRTAEHQAKLTATMYGRNPSAETRKAMSESAKNRKKVECVHCGKLVPPQQINRWHNDNCKHRK